MKLSRTLNRGAGMGRGMVGFLALALAVAAQAGSADAPSAGDKFRQIDQALRLAEGHPNEEHRLYALRAYAKGEVRLAAEQFRLAAGFADKFSQHRLSLMCWNGEGVARDPVIAYVWADLAAERGTPNLLANREKMWGKLSAAEREQVGKIGPDYYAQFGDTVAKPKQIAEMRRFANRRTGSRVGWNGSRLDVSVPQSGDISQTDASVPIGDADLYGADRTNPERYWRIQDAILAGGTVEVGGPDSVVPESEAAPKSP